MKQCKPIPILQKEQMSRLLLLQRLKLFLLIPLLREEQVPCLLLLQRRNLLLLRKKLWQKPYLELSPLLEWKEGRVLPMGWHPR